MNREEFRRIELAYALSKSAATAALNEFRGIADRIGLRHTGPNFVETLYFDDAGHSLYWQGRMQVEDQMQVRIRSYQDTPGPKKFIEIKRKTGDYVEKLRTMASVSGWGGGSRVSVSGVSDTDSGVLGLFHQIVHDRRLRPTMLMSYRRTALSSVDGDWFRLTADEWITAIDVVAPRWSQGRTRTVDFVVLELKTSAAMNESLSEAIGRLSLGSPQRVSKFEKCTEVLFDVNERRGQTI